MNLNKKGIHLYSGGLDSILSARLLIDQGINLIGVNFILPFTPPDFNPHEYKTSKLAESIGLPLRFIRLNIDYMEMVKNPPHGYGKNINPCIDCKIYFLKKAKQIMHEENASFVSTGEVVGQRPMSQMKNMLKHIEKESGLSNDLLRPLSAKLLQPTNAENNGIVDRSRLLDISGRTRKKQIELAEKYSINDYASPAGGCLFTDKNYAAKLRDLFYFNPDYNMTDIYLLTVGRHYRLHEHAKIIVSRNEKENNELEKYRQNFDYFVEPEFKGAFISVKGRLDDNNFEIISSISGRYGKFDNQGMINIHDKNMNCRMMEVNSRISDELLDKLRI